MVANNRAGSSPVSARPSPDGEAPLAPAYDRARQQGIIVPHPAQDIVRMSGASHLDLLQRMSTNELARLPPMSVRTTILTNALARMVDVIQLLHRGEDSLLLCSPGRSETVRQWLLRHVFFQDDVRLEAWDADCTGWGLYGRLSGDHWPRLGSLAPYPGSGSLARIPGGFAWPCEGPLGGGLRLLLEPAAAEQPGWEWLAASADEPARQVYRILRIEAGLPEFGLDIDEDLIPLEANLRHAISFDKGCYIGQEIIARMDSRGRLARQLIGAQLDGPAEPGEELHSEGRRIGRLGSVALSPSWGWIGLAIVERRSMEEPERQIHTRQSARALRLVSLPFPA
jgi:tRNA-modifying protein YgfZ